jgi:hypothetical protein
MEALAAPALGDPPRLLRPGGAVPPAEQVAEALYLRLRPSYDGPDATLAALQTVLIDRPGTALPPADATMLKGCSEVWERAYVERSLNQPGRLAAQRLDDLRRIAQQAKDALDEAAARLRPIPTSGGVAKTPTTAQFQQWRLCWQTYREALDAAQRAEDGLRRQALESTTSADARQEIEGLAAALLAEFGGRGVQYELLCHQLAEVAVKLRQLGASGRAVPVEEFAKLQTLQVQIVAQIQRQAEGHAAEVVASAQREMALAVMSVVEQVVAPVYPKLWAEIFEAVQRRMRERTTTS